jgi:hypothetical protein
LFTFHPFYSALSLGLGSEVAAEVSHPLSDGVVEGHRRAQERHGNGRSDVLHRRQQYAAIGVDSFSFSFFFLHFFLSILFSCPCSRRSNARGDFQRYLLEAYSDVAIGYHLVSLIVNGVELVSISLSRFG